MEAPSAMEVPGESSGNPGSEGGKNIQQLETNLETLIELLRQCSIIVEDFQEESQPVLHSKINAVIDQLGTLDTMANDFMDGPLIPEAILEYLDQGKNPDIYTKEVLDEVKQKNDITRGKIRGYQTFKEALLSEYHKKPEKEEEMP